MKKQKIQLLALGVILVLVLIAFLVLRHRQETESESDQEYTSYSVLSLSEDEPGCFTVINEGEIFVFMKGEDGWESEGRTADMLNQDTLEAMLAQVVSLRADDRIEDVSDLSEFGLMQPQVSVILTMADGTEYQLAFGDYNEMMGVYYLGLNNSNVVYTTPLNIKGSFQITWEELETDSSS